MGEKDRNMDIGLLRLGESQRDRKSERGREPESQRAREPEILDSEIERERERER